MKITKDWLKEKNISNSHLKIFLNQKEDDLLKVIGALKEENFHFATWLIVTCLNGKNVVKFAIYCGELVLPLFEKHRPNDFRPREAIKCAKKYDKNTSEENWVALSDAADATCKSWKDAKNDNYYNIGYAALAAFNVTMVAGSQSKYFCTDREACVATSCAAAATKGVLLPSKSKHIESKMIDYGIQLLQKEGIL